MTVFSKNMLEFLAGLGDPDDRFSLDEMRPENVFYGPKDTVDEVTVRRLGRATHVRMDSLLNEDPAMGQLSRRQVPMYEPSAGVRKPQAYLADPQFEELEEPEDAHFPPVRPSLHDVLFGDLDDIYYDMFFDDADEFEEYSEETPTTTPAPDHSYGYGHGAQSGRRPGYGARSAGYINDSAE
jgi:hypothetical protein